jgi:hypothetical protein
VRAWVAAYAFVVASLAGCLGDDRAIEPTLDAAPPMPVCSTLACLSIACSVERPSPDSVCSCFISPSDSDESCRWGIQPPYCSGEGGAGCHP